MHLYCGINKTCPAFPDHSQARKGYASWVACLLQQTPPRRIYRRIKRDSGPSKSNCKATNAPAAAPASTAGRGAAPPQPPHQPSAVPLPVLDFDVAEARKAGARWGPMGTPPVSAPLMIWPLHPGNPNLQSQIIRVDKEHVFPEDRGGGGEGGEDPPLLAEESSSGSRLNSKKRSAPTTLVNTPHMLQQLAKEGSSRNSTCSSNSDETGSQGSDESDDSEPDVVSRQQHPFGMQNGLKGTGNSASHPKAVAATAAASTAAATAAAVAPSTGGPAPLPAAQRPAGASPGGRVRSASPVLLMAASQPMTASQLRQRRQQEDAMPSTGYHVPGNLY